MWLFVGLFFLVSTAFTVLKLSLSSSYKMMLVGVAIIMLVVGVTFPWAVEINNQSLQWLLKQESIVGLVAMLQIFEAIAMIFLNVILIRDHYAQKSKKWIKWLVTLPSVVCLIGLFFLQAYVYIYTTSLPYWILAVFFSLGAGLLLLGTTRASQIIMPLWDLRAELTMLLGLFQVLLAMFLPLIVKGVSVPFNNLVVDMHAMLITAVIVVVLAGAGLIIFILKNQIKKYR